MAKIPSVVEISSCDYGCPPRVKKLPIIAINSESLDTPNFSDKIKRH
jgi:hypothetical protein